MDNLVKRMFSLEARLVSTEDGADNTDAGIVAEGLDNMRRLHKIVEANKPLIAAYIGNAISANAEIKALRTYIEDNCSGTAGKEVNGNRLSASAKHVLATAGASVSIVTSKPTTSMDVIKKPSTASLAVEEELGVIIEILREELREEGTEMTYKLCSKLQHAVRARGITRESNDYLIAEEYSDTLRELASYVGCGGYNSDGLINPSVAKDKVIHGIDFLCNVEEKRRTTAEAIIQSVRDAIKNKDPKFCGSDINPQFGRSMTCSPADSKCTSCQLAEAEQLIERIESIISD